MTELTEFAVRRDRHLDGILPDETLQEMRSLTSFMVAKNRFSGILPEGGLQVMIDLNMFSIASNHFRGMLPCVIQGWTKLQMLHMQINYCAGMVPERGLQGM
eukprot:1604135-Amphidinium_carterae.1